MRCYNMARWLNVMKWRASAFLRCFGHPWKLYMTKTVPVPEMLSMKLVSKNVRFLDDYKNRNCWLEKFLLQSCWKELAHLVADFRKPKTWGRFHAWVESISRFLRSFPFCQGKKKLYIFLLLKKMGDKNWKPRGDCFDIKQTIPNMGR